MLAPSSCASLSALSAALVVLAGSARAQFTNNTADIPTGGGANNSWSENVDFADVDLDGDWDCAWADGGDLSNDQNRIWINLGGLQGGAVGVFEDQTDTRCPLVNDDSRDVEFVDFDGDGDVDLHSTNTATLTNQSNRWWTNQGGDQGGELGFFVDETQARWVGLGTGTSSVAPAMILAAGGFIDWCSDSDFADLDNDGDMDLVHSTYSSSFSGQVPTRLFLNDGAGFFTEFNPSGFQLPGSALQEGDPALWCEGVQQQNTTDTTGMQADIKTTALDVDLGDVDGDFDLDLLHGERDNAPRFFHNRLEENGGALGFRDVTAAVYPAAVLTSTGGGNYEQELGDIDGDGDLDLYGLNWSGFSDVAYRNTAGVFGDATVLLDSSADEEEVDFLDYDNDGDLDAFVANFSGTSKLYENTDTGSGSVGLKPVPGAVPDGDRSRDVEACDVDQDGDYDVFLARDGGGNENKYLENTTGTPDTHAPAIPALEDAGDQVASATPLVVRAAVYDNAPYYITWYNGTFAEVTVDGHRIPDVALRSSGGQIFRAELPGNLVGAVSYRVRSSDEYGNTGFSPTRTYTGSTALAIGGNYGSGTNGSLGVPTLEALSVAFAGTTLYFAGGNAPPNTPYFLSLNSAATAPIPIPGFGTLNVGGTTFTILTGSTSAGGDIVGTLPLSSGLPSGASLFMQWFTLDGQGGDLLASSLGLEVVTQ